MAGTLYGVGVGPGDPELLTMKTVKTLSACAVIGIPNADTALCTAWKIAVLAVPEIAEKEILRVPVPMTKDISKLNNAYIEGCKNIAKTLDSGKNIAFLNLGDPTLYGSYMEIHKRICSLGYRAEIVNGIPSICAVAAALGEALGERDEAIHIFPGNYDLRSLDKIDGTIVLMKPASKLPAVKRQLQDIEMRGDYDISAVANCGMDNQTIYPSIRDLDEEAGYFVTILVKKRSPAMQHIEAEERQ